MVSPVTRQTEGEDDPSAGNHGQVQQCEYDYQNLGHCHFITQARFVTRTQLPSVQI